MFKHRQLMFSTGFLALLIAGEAWAEGPETRGSARVDVERDTPFGE